MNILLKNFVSRLPVSFFDLLRRELAPLAASRRIDEARVTVERSEQASPPWQLAVHLVTPGPDFTVRVAAHTVRDAVTRAVAALAGKIALRHEKRARRLRAAGAPRGAVARA